MSIKVHVYVSTGIQGSDHNAILTFDDGTSEDQIEESCRDWMFERIEWGWGIVSDEQAERLKQTLGEIEE